MLFTLPVTNTTCFNVMAIGVHAYVYAYIHACMHAHTRYPHKLTHIYTHTIVIHTLTQNYKISPTLTWWARLASLSGGNEYSATCRHGDATPESPLTAWCEACC